MEKSWTWGCITVIPVTAGSLKHEDCGPGQPGQKSETHLRNNQEKKGLEAWLKCGLGDTAPG
jgi:hypothetical protein